MSLACTSICPLCGMEFKQKSILVNHLNRKNMCTPLTPSNKKILNAYVQRWDISLGLGHRHKCKYCDKEYTRSSYQKTHMLKCELNPNFMKPEEMVETIKNLKAVVQGLANGQQEINQSQDKLTERHEKLAKEIPQQINQIVKEQTQHVKPNNLLVSIGNNEDLFQRLETLMGNEVEVLNYIVDCALGDKHGSGSSKLVKKAYDLGLNFQEHGVLPAFGWDDTKLTRVRFRNHKGEWEIESKQQFADRITEYLKTCYNKTFQKLVKYKSDNGEYPCEWDTYRLTSWNEMSSLRSQPRFKKDLINGLGLSKINNEFMLQTRTPISDPNMIKPKSTLTTRRIIQDNEDSDTKPEANTFRNSIDPISDDEYGTEFINSSMLFPSHKPIIANNESITDIRQLTKAAPPSTFIPGAPPELIPMKYVSPNTIAIKALIHNKGNQKGISKGPSKPIF